METTILFEVLAYAVLCVLAVPHYLWCNKMVNMTRGKNKLSSINLRNWKKHHALLALAMVEVVYLFFGGLEISIVMKVLLTMQIVGWALQIPSSFFMYKKLKEQDRLDAGSFEIYIPKDLVHNILRKSTPGIFGA